jgi:hypothetical protein
VYRLDAVGAASRHQSEGEDEVDRCAETPCGGLTHRFWDRSGQKPQKRDANGRTQIHAWSKVDRAAEEERLIEERQAEEARKADAADAQLEASRSEAPPYIADKFKRAFERGRSAWLNAQ